MTEAELQYEWDVTYETRLGMLCGTGTPTEFMVILAKDEAAEHVRKLMEVHEVLHQLDQIPP